MKSSVIALLAVLITIDFENVQAANEKRYKEKREREKNEMMTMHSKAGKGSKPHPYTHAPTTYTPTTFPPTTYHPVSSVFAEAVSTSTYFDGVF